MDRGLRDKHLHLPDHSIRLVLLSDTHELHREIEVPAGDILLFAGDFTMFSKSVAAIRDFNAWLGDLPCPAVVIPGNHEFFLEADPMKESLLSNATVLINEGVEIKGLKIWGSPITSLYSGAFGLGSPADRRRIYANIPEDTDILLTHSPPYGILDNSPGSDVHAGCPELLEAVERVRPKLHVFGHIHGAHGLVETEHTTYVNAALLGHDGDLAYKPIVLRMSAE